MNYSIPTFIELFSESPNPPSLEVLSELQTVAAKVLSRAIDYGGDTDALAASIACMNLDISRLLESIWIVEEAIDTVFQGFDSDKD